MHKELIIDAFQKAEKKLIKKGVNEPSKRQISMELSSYFADDYGFTFGDRSLRDYYDAALASEGSNIANVRIVEGLCQYLGYKDYQDYLKSKKDSTADLGEKSKRTVKPNRRKINLSIGIAISFIAFMILFLIFNPTKQKWMVWNGDHYEEVDFNKEGIANGTLKLLKEERIEHFRKVNTPDCNYSYFNEDGSVSTWYGKNKNGDIEIFTDIGLHPETGKSLKPITIYMIRKYLCDSY